MRLLEKIEKYVHELPQEKQMEVLDFVTFLSKKNQQSPENNPKPASLDSHPAFGSWKSRNIDALAYEQAIRSEWEPRG